MTIADFVILHYQRRATGDSAFALVARLHFDGVRLPHGGLSFIQLLKLEGCPTRAPFCAMDPHALVCWLLAQEAYAVDTARALAYINAHATKKDG
jgi:hypothetical protein